MKETYITCEENGRSGAERAAARHLPGGDLYRAGFHTTSVGRAGGSLFLRA